MQRLFTYCVCFVLFVCVGAVSDPTAQGAPQSGEPIYPTVFVVRHAEAYQNVSPPPGMPKEKLDSLTPRGIEQARKTGAYLKDKNVSVVIASPTGRTTETACIIAEEIGFKGSFSEDRAYASMEKGMTAEGKPADWSWRKKQWREGRDPRPKGGESLADATKRAVEALEILIKKFPGKGLVIITHSDICAGLAGHADDTPYPERYEKHGTSLGSVIEIAVSPDGTWVLL
jgi:broad specificity phosphatase PhoE